MKNWQKNRNYKRVKDKDGNVVANIITVFGQDVEVSDEIFTAYMQMDNHAPCVCLPDQDTVSGPQGRVRICKSEDAL